VVRQDQCYGRAALPATSRSHHKIGQEVGL
jgi:hypothetical protein